MRILLHQLLLAIAIAATACAEAAQLPDDLPLKDFALPRGSTLLKSERTVSPEDQPGQPPVETRWTLEFRTAEEWPAVGAHVTGIVNVRNGLLPVAQESISGVHLDDLVFFSSDQRLSVRLHELTEVKGQPAETGRYDYQITVIETAVAQQSPPAT